MKISSAEFLMSNTDIQKCPSDGLPEYAFIGRSNVGKSSLINMLTGYKGLALTSSKPGKTLLINHFLVNKSWYLVDLPGYGYAQRNDKNRNLISDIIKNYILKRTQLTNLFLLIDSRLSPQTIDLNFINWLGENGIPFSIVFTKVDKLKPSQLNNNIKVILSRLQEEWEELPPTFITSSESRTGRDEILAYIDSINSSLSNSDIKQ